MQGSGVPNDSLCAYTADDLKCLRRAGLRKLVEKQRSCWPKDIPFNTKVTNVQLRSALLDPKNGFTTDQDGGRSSSASQHSIQNLEQSDDPLPAAAPMLGNLNVFAVDARPPTRSEPHERSLRLYIEDDCFHAPIRTCTTIVAPVASYVPSGAGAWLVEAQVVLSKLQASPEEIYGPGRFKIGVPDDLRPEHTCHFVETTVVGLLHAPTNPTHLVVPAHNAASLTLRISKIATDRVSAQGESHNFNDSHPGPQVGKSRRCERLPDVANRFENAGEGSHRATLPEHSGRSLDLDARQSTKHSRLGVSESITQRLEQLVSARPGYQEFCDARGSTLQNPQILPTWKFAVDFKACYYKKASSVISDELPIKPITKSSILRALRIGETWLKDAEDGVRLAGQYGSDGVLPVPEVVSELMCVRESPRGRGELLKFLRAWEAGHPIYQ